MKRDTKIVAAFLVAVPALILLASTVCAWAVAHGASPRWRLVFRVFCHGIARRCLLLFGVPMPVCARCTAIYVGIVVAAAAFFVLPANAERTMRMVVYAATIPIAVDGITQALLLRESTNSLRMATGFIAAFAFGMWALTAIERRRPAAVNPS
jgi:uncharacterized membrane protein